MRPPSRGLFVTIDGPAGVGKTTTTRLLREHLAHRGYQVHATTQPLRGVLGDTARHNTDTYGGHTPPPAWSPPTRFR